MLKSAGPSRDAREVRALNGYGESLFARTAPSPVPAVCSPCGPERGQPLRGSSLWRSGLVLLPHSRATAWELVGDSSFGLCRALQGLRKEGPFPYPRSESWSRGLVWALGIAPEAERALLHSGVLAVGQLRPPSPSSGRALVLPPSLPGNCQALVAVCP